MLCFVFLVSKNARGDALSEEILDTHQTVMVDVYQPMCNEKCDGSCENSND